MAGRSLRSLIQNELATALKFVLDGGECDQLPTGCACICDAQLVLSQFGEAVYCGSISRAACSLQRQLLIAGEEPHDLTANISSVKRWPSGVSNSNQFAAGAHKGDTSLESAHVLLPIEPEPPAQPIQGFCHGGFEFGEPDAVPPSVNPLERPAGNADKAASNCLRRIGRNNRKEHCGSRNGQREGNRGIEETDRIVCHPVLKSSGVGEVETGYESEARCLFARHQIGTAKQHRGNGEGEHQEARCVGEQGLDQNEGWGSCQD